MILSGVLILSQLIAQSSSQNSTLKDALKSFENRDYELAVSAFESILIDNPQDRSFLPQLALSYKRTGRFDQANGIYQQLVKEAEVDPEVYYQYGELLKSEGHYLEAKSYFLEYSKTNPIIGNYFAESCEYAHQQLSKPSQCKLNNLDSNSGSPDFAPVFIDEHLLFLSGTGSEMTVKSPTSLSGTDNKIIVYKGIQEILEKETGTLGNISISEDKSFLAFSRMQNPNERESIEFYHNLEIMFAQMDLDGSWKDVESFKYNSKLYSVGFPCLAENGKVLYFASNEPGGYGGYDIYVSFLDGQQQWSKPLNMGAVINTAGNELAPYYKNGNLYFSSDKHQGFGGLDVFRTGIANEQQQSIVNMGTCVNSSKDEFFFILDKQGNGYFTSNREGGKGESDIYKAFQVKLESVDHSLQSIKDKPEPGTVASQNNNLVEKGERLVSEEMLQSSAPEVVKPTQQPEKLYFIQLNSLAKYKSSMDDSYKRFASYGDVYKVNIEQLTKIRVGPFSNVNEAIAIMRQIKKNGAKDAFIVTDVLDMSRTFLISAALNKSENTKVQPSVKDTPPPVVEEEGKYKIRVAEYKAPDWFDVSKISDLGRIEHWTKNGWTIIVLGSYTTEQTAANVMKQLKERGFKEAYMVVEENGKLYRL